MKAIMCAVIVAVLAACHPEPARVTDLEKRVAALEQQSIESKAQLRDISEQSGHAAKLIQEMSDQTTPAIDDLRSAAANARELVGNVQEREALKQRLAATQGGVPPAMKGTLHGGNLAQTTSAP